MNKIQIKVLNPSAVAEATDTMVMAARLTQHGPEINTIEDATAVLQKPYSDNLIQNLVQLPHPTLQKFSIINVLVVGASRRFLAQITRHQNEVKFMSTSLQYSNYSSRDAYVIPYEILCMGSDKIEQYLNICKTAGQEYATAIKEGISNDSAGYILPQSLRVCLLISASVYQWKHMISQRICRRNTPETRYIMLRVWEELFALNRDLFSPKTTGSYCMQLSTCYRCLEGKMSCGQPLGGQFIPSPSVILDNDFKLLRGK